MAEPVNLNKARKARERSEARRRAAENRVKHGRTKAQKAADAAEARRLAGRPEELGGDGPSTEG